jgi:hypothetical protein
MPGRRVELPINPERFRGCSTPANNKWRGPDSSSVSVLARFCAPLPTLLLVFCYYGKFRSETVCCCCVPAEMLGEARV